MQDTLEPLLSLEQTFYNQGLAVGTPHGALHGLFEGRSLGREKGWELWEEVGYYEGVAKLWCAVLRSQGKEGGRAHANLEQVLLMVSSFPTSNDSTSLSTPAAPASDAGIDIPVLLTSIRSKYRAACASLGIRPRMIAGDVEGVQKVAMAL